MKPELININPVGGGGVKIKHLETRSLISSFHFHNLCELVWVEKSHGKRIVGDHVGNFQDGDLVVMGPNLPHIWQNDRSFSEGGEVDLVRSTVIYFPADILQRLTDDEATLQSVAEFVLRAERGLKILGETNREVSRHLLALRTQTGFERIVTTVKIIEFLVASTEFEYLASVGFKHQFDERDNNRINKVYQFLMQNFHRDINLDEVASLCNMTTNSFCRFFKARSHKSLTQFLNEIRVGHACKLLQYTDDPISAICFASGYNNLTNFNKFFKHIMGMKPSEYRRNIVLS